MTESTPTIAVTLNGDPRELPGGLTVATLLQHLGIEPLGVAVEQNRKVVRRAAHEKTAVESGDVIEIVRFVGGG